MTALKVDRSELLAVLALLDRARGLRDVGDLQATHIERMARDKLALIIDSSELVWEIRNG
jgi:hypothetical protein